MKTEEDEAFEDIERKQGGFQAKREAALDRLVQEQERLGLYDLAPQPAQEPVALVIDGVLVKSALPEKYTGHFYTTPPQRPWVGLTDADIERIKLMTYEKETNADGEEQEAVNIDWLIKTTEHFCKENNNGT